MMFLSEKQKKFTKIFIFSTFFIIFFYEKIELYLMLVVYIFPHVCLFHS